MEDIIRIVIKGSSGYGCVDEAFHDKLTLTEGSISYEYIPYIETEINPKSKWSYKTNSMMFKVCYKRIAGMIPAVIENPIITFSVDTGKIEFIITYSNKEKFKGTYDSGDDRFKELFNEIKQLVPEEEFTPAVLMTSEDYEDGEGIM